MLAAELRPLGRVVPSLPCAGRRGSEGIATTLRATTAASAGSEGGQEERRENNHLQTPFSIPVSPDPGCGLQAAPGACHQADVEGPFTDSRERRCEPSVQAGTTSPSVIKQRCLRLEVLAL